MRRNEEGDHSRCLQYNPDNTRHRCLPKSRRNSGGSHKEVRSKWAEIVVYANDGKQGTLVFVRISSDVSNHEEVLGPFRPKNVRRITTNYKYIVLGSRASVLALLLNSRHVYPRVVGRTTVFAS